MVERIYEACVDHKRFKYSTKMFGAMLSASVEMIKKSKEQQRSRQKVT